MEIPVVFIIYNRPGKTRRSFEAIRAAMPTQLYIVADGAKNNSQDALLVAETRQIAEQVDWACSVKYIYAIENLSCAKRVTTGLNEVFAECEKAIILEDDIVAAPTFFTFCSNMLNRYEHDEKIMAVTGWNGLIAYQPDRYSAFFSKYPSVWGWATWRRAWATYQAEPSWPTEQITNRLQEYFPEAFRRKLYQHNYQHQLWQRLQNWDLPWSFAIFMNDGIVITPTVNLCQNIGFDAEGTHLTGFNIRGIFPALSLAADSGNIPVKERYDTENDWYDYSCLLFNTFSLYEDIRKLLLVFKNQQLLLKNQHNIGWECSLQPFNEPERCMDILQHLEKYITHPHLTMYKEVFKKLL